MPILIASISVYSIYFMLWYKTVLPVKNNQWVLFCVSVALCTAAFLLSVKFDLYRTGIFIVMGTAMFAFRLTFSSSNLQAFYFSTFYILSAYSSRGIIASVFSLVQNESINDVFRTPTYYNLIWVFAVLLSILIFFFRRQIVSSDNRIKQLFNYPNEIKFIVTIRVILIIYIMLIDDGRYRDVPYIWFSTMYLLSCIMIKVSMLLVENHAIKVSSLLEYELNTRQLEQQLARQLRHYHSYKKYTENFAAFKHMTLKI